MNDLIKAIKTIIKAKLQNSEKNMLKLVILYTTQN